MKIRRPPKEYVHRTRFLVLCWSGFGASALASMSMLWESYALVAAIEAGPGVPEVDSTRMLWRLVVCVLGLVIFSFGHIAYGPRWRESGLRFRWQQPKRWKPLNARSRALDLAQGVASFFLLFALATVILRAFGDS